MAAAYLTRADLEAVIGTALVEALFTESADVGSEDTTRITAAIAYSSAMTQLYALSRGYTVSDSLSTTSTDNLLKLATIGAVIEMAYGMGKNAVPKPDGWVDHPARRAYTDLLSGDLPLPSASLESISAIGGWSFTPTSETDLDLSAPRRTQTQRRWGF